MLSSNFLEVQTFLAVFLDEYLALLYVMFLAAVHATEISWDRIMAKFAQQHFEETPAAGDQPVTPGIWTIARINRLPEREKRAIYASFIPPALLAKFGMRPETLCAQADEQLFICQCPPRASAVRLELRHVPDFPDPLFLLEMRDTSFGDIEILFVNINNPFAERFEIDRDENGNSTGFGTLCRNIPEEIRAMRAGLAPGQVRSGLRMYRAFLAQVHAFCRQFGICRVKAEAFAYHNAIMHEFYGFRYITGQTMMEEIDREFAPGGVLFKRLDDSTPFRQAGFERSIKGRSWAIHDGILGCRWECPRMYHLIEATDTRGREAFTCHLLRVP